MTSKCFHIVCLRDIKKKKEVSVVPAVVVLVKADLPGGGVGEVPGTAIVEDILLELRLRLLQAPDLVMKLGKLWIQGPLLRGQLHLGTNKKKIKVKKGQKGQKKDEVF